MNSISRDHFIAAGFQRRCGWHRRYYVVADGIDRGGLGHFPGQKESRRLSLYIPDVRATPLLGYWLANFIFDAPRDEGHL